MIARHAIEGDHDIIPIQQIVPNWQQKASDASSLPELAELLQLPPNLPPDLAVGSMCREMPDAARVALTAKQVPQQILRGNAQVGTVVTDPRNPP